MNKLVRDNTAFLYPYAFLLVVGIIFILSVDKLQLHLSFGQLHSPMQDQLWPVLTHLGDGIVVGIVALIALLIKVRYGLIIGLAAILNGVSTQFFKRQVFDMPRPSHYLSGHPDFVTVPGFDMAEHFSFPSGHTSAAFCLYFCLAAFVPQRWLKVVFLLLAVVSAYSRIYLNQHFLEDVLAGSLLGIFWVMLIYPIFSTTDWALKSKWLKASVLKR